MSDFDGTVQRPAGPEDTDGANPVGMEDGEAAGQTDTQADTPPSNADAHTDFVGEELGLTEDQVLGREPLPDSLD